ncbi:protein O-linked-mannose beta-1,2-N-acetylglucosaminyltransferase 1-like [Macrobrachium rosenbergii]|uniref:protein O-linked-mannose beta-1,2-N-acetylglucosaminyltransferase 1-like n=1 Tax=Macrobrachium rosenbergii TaxID=79674 RepID=UPI0034D3B615
MLRKDLPFEIPNETRVFLQKMGSIAIEFLGPGMTWTWVWVKGGYTVAEGVTFPTARDMAPRHLLHFQVELTPKTEFCPEWPHTPHWENRRVFCSRYERCGDLCDCQKPYVFNTTEQKLRRHRKCCGGDSFSLIHEYFLSHYRSLKSLASAEGFNKSRLRVYTQTHHVELEEFLRLADVSLTVTNRSHDLVSTHIARQIVFALNDTLHRHLDADYVIFLEEDVRVSPDFFVFLNRSAKLLREDATLYCVSAHNDLSYPHTSYDAGAVLRAESYPNYGWMVQRSFAEEMVEVMSGIQTEFDWDVVTYYHIRRGRECVIPEVSRSQHFTFGGAHISQWDARRFYSRKNLNEDSTAVVKNVSDLKNETYEAYLESMLDKAYFINAEEISPCTDDFFHLIPTEGQEVLVLFFYTDVDITLFRINIQWKTLAECLGTFSIESREGHHGLYRMRYGPAHFFLIAYPASPYSRFKPADIGVFNATLEEQRYAQFRSLPEKKVYNLNAVDEVFGATNFESLEIT